MPLVMADDSSSPTPQERQFAGRQGGRSGPGRDQGGREPGGFRIRLSDNEMRAARAVQEAFRLRSTVAALGFALRATAQLLEEGKLDELVAQQRAQGPSRGDGPRGDGPRGGRRDGRLDGRQERAPRVDPFARPSRPAPAPAAEAVATDEVVATADEAAEADVALVETEAPADEPAADAAAE
jgi:hypothetical protein